MIPKGEGAMDWKKTLATVAPALATALGGPLAGTAVKVIASALGLEAASEEEIAKVVAQADPDTLLKLKQAEQEFQLKLKELEIDLERLAVEDRASARKRQVETGDRTPTILAYIYTFMFFAVLAFQAVAAFQGLEIPQGVQRTLDTTLGALFAMLFASKDYFFGSSIGSRMKDKVLEKVRT